MQSTPSTSTEIAVPTRSPQSPLFIKGGLVALAFALLVGVASLYTGYVHSPLLVLTGLMPCYFALKDILARQDYRGAYVAAAFVVGFLLLPGLFT